jgi:hypothetical protein
MRVIANKIGFYGQLRKVGESFTIKNKEALGSWMDEVKAKKTPAKEEVKVS